MQRALTHRSVDSYRSRLLFQISDMERALSVDSTSAYYRGRLEAFRLSLDFFDISWDDLRRAA